MKVDAIQSNQQNFGAKFIMNKNLEEIFKYSSFDKKTVKLAKKFARKHRGHELFIDTFESQRDKYHVIVRNNDVPSACEFNYAKKHSGARDFSINQFFKDVINTKWLYSFDNQVQTKRAILGQK